MIPERRRELAVLAAVLIAALVGLWTAIVALIERPETARAGRTVISVRTPEVAPGDPIAVRVIVRGGKKSAVEEIAVRGGEQALQVRGPGATWGRSFRVSQRSGGVAEHDLAVQVPADAAPGSTLALRFEVRSVVAAERGPGRFENVDATDVVTVDVPVLTAAQRDRARLLGAALALALLVAAAVAAGLATPPIVRQLRRRTAGRPDRSAVTTALLMVVAIAFPITALTAAATYGLAGWFYFAPRMVASTAVLDGWLPWTALAAWVAVPGLVVLVVAQRLEGELAVSFAAAAKTSETPYRDEHLAERPGVALDALAGALTGAGFAVRRRGRRLHAREGSSRVAIDVRKADDITAADLRVWTRESPAALAVALALVPVLGPLTVTFDHLGALTVDGTRGRDALLRDLAEATRRRIADVLAQVLPPRPG